MVNAKSAAILLFACLAIACGRNDATKGATRGEELSPLDQEFRLADAEPVEIDAFFTLFPAERRPTYQSTRFDSALGATIVEGIEIPGEHKGGAIRIERAEFFGLDLAAVSRLRDGAAVDGYETVFAKIRLLNVRSDGYADDDATAKLSIAAVEIDRLDMQALDDRANAAEIASAIKLAGLYFKDFRLFSVTSETPSVDFSAPDLRIMDYRGGAIGAVTGKGFSYEIAHSQSSIGALTRSMGPQAALLLGSLKGFIAPDRQTTKIGEVDWRAIDFSGLMAFAARGEPPSITEKDLIDLGTMKARAMETLIDGKRAAFIDEATMSAGAFTWLIPSNIRADTKGAIYDLTAYVSEDEAAAIGVLRNYGLDDVRGDGVAEWRWNEKSGKAVLDYIARTDVFADLRVNLRLSGFVYDDMIKASQSGERNAVASLGALDGFSFAITDKNALAAGFDIAALETGGSGQDLRQSMPAMIRVMSLQAATVNQRAIGYADAIADFIAEGGTLELSAAPSTPASFDLLQSGAISPEDLPDVINLTVTHKE